MNRLLNDLSNLAGNSKNKGMAHYNFAMSSLKRKDYSNAVKSFLKALELDNTDKMQAIVKPNLGMAYLMLEKYEAAIIELEIASRLKNTSDGNAFIHANLGYAYSKIDNYGLAILEYKKSLKFRPGDPKNHYSLSLLYNSKFQTDLAHQELEKAIEIEPNNQTYKSAYENLDEDSLLSLKVGRIAHPLLTLGIIAVPYFDIRLNKFVPLIVYIYDESPLKKLAKPGDMITNLNESKNDKSLFESLKLNPGIRTSLTINKSKVVVTGIPPIKRKLDQTEKIKLYQNWFRTFDSRIVDIWEFDFDKEKEELGAKWGYEFESLIRSWVAYKDQDPLFDSAFSLMMEFFHAFKYKDSDDNEVHYEINLAKLKFKLNNILTINFFKEINFMETAKYLENKLFQEKSGK